MNLNPLSRNPGFSRESKIVFISSNNFVLKWSENKYVRLKILMATGYKVEEAAN